MLASRQSAMADHEPERALGNAAGRGAPGLACAECFAREGTEALERGLRAGERAPEERPRVDHVGLDLEGHLDPRAASSCGDVARVVEEHLGAAGEHEQRRQAAQVGVDGRREGFRTSPLAHEAADVDAKDLAAHVVVGRVGLHRGAPHLEVGPGRDADGGGRQRHARVAQGDQHGEREPGTRRLARHDDARWIDSSAEEPAVGRHGVVELRRERVLGGQPVVDDEPAGARREAEPRDRLAVRVDRSDGVPAAVQVQNHPRLVASVAAEPFGRDASPRQSSRSASSASGTAE